jgi:hypothetical protein
MLNRARLWLIFISYFKWMNSPTYANSQLKHNTIYKVGRSIAITIAPCAKYTKSIKVFYSKAKEKSLICTGLPLLSFLQWLDQAIGFLNDFLKIFFPNQRILFIYAVYFLLCFRWPLNPVLRWVNSSLSPKFRRVMVLPTHKSVVNFCFLLSRDSKFESAWLYF